MVICTTEEAIWIRKMRPASCSWPAAAAREQGASSTRAFYFEVALAQARRVAAARVKDIVHDTGLALVLVALESVAVGHRLPGRPTLVNNGAATAHGFEKCAGNDVVDVHQVLRQAAAAAATACRYGQALYTRVWEGTADAPPHTRRRW